MKFMSKVKVLLASLTLAFGVVFFTPQTSQALSQPLSLQTEEMSALEMRGHRGYRGHHGFRGHRGYGRAYGHRRMYAPPRRVIRPHYGFMPRPVYCRTVVRYDAWGYPVRRRICR